MTNIMTMPMIDVDCFEKKVVCDGIEYACAIGRGGVIDEQEKREGDGATPRGRYPIRHLYWRADRLARPITKIDCRPLKPTDGWCDDPTDPAYNCPVQLPYTGRTETLWREDHIYDVILVIGHNDNPAIAGKGSAIFFHIARPDYGATEGCVALAPQDLLAVLQKTGPQTIIQIR